MALKALMVDVDGVVVNPGFPKRRWDETMEADLGLSPELLQREFFRPHFKAISLGREPLEPRLGEVLARVAPHVPAQALMAYWFDKDSVLDRVLLDDLAGYRAAGLQLHLATVQEHRRAAYLWETLDLKSRFDGLHHSAAVGFQKPDIDYFRAVESRTGFGPQEVLLIDDSPRNVEGALAVGWAAVLWTGEARLDEVLPQI